MLRSQSGAELLIGAVYWSVSCMCHMQLCRAVAAHVPRGAERDHKVAQRAIASCQQVTLLSFCGACTARLPFLHVAAAVTLLPYVDFSDDHHQS